MALKKRRKKHKSRGLEKSNSKFRKKEISDDINRLNSGESQIPSSGNFKEIKKLISKGKIKAAVNRAKQYHNHLGTEESEAILKEAYIARILEMLDKGHMVEAKSLLDLVWERYHWPDHGFAEINAIIYVRSGKIDDLAAPLNDPSISREKRAAVEKIIKRELVDLNALAACKSLSPDHPLKTEAFAAARAFDAVTTGPVDDEEMALSGIPRKSPLAPWKMLIKALACFYRYNDGLCERYLQAVEPDSAPSRLVPVIQAIVSGKTEPNLDKDAHMLIEQVRGNREDIRNTFQAVERALATRKSNGLLKAISDAIGVCKASCPGLVERLKQHISIRSWMIEAEAKPIEIAMGGPSTKNAYFWRLHARAAEAKNQCLLASALWDEFTRHALHEGWFSADGKELSVIYLHMATLLQRIPDGDFEWHRFEFERKFKGFESHYHGQPRPVSDVVRKGKRQGIDPYFLYPEQLYRLACKTDPTSETFGQWLEWIDKNRPDWKNSDEVALAWHEAIPDDVRPLLHLTKSAEKRNALKKSLGYLEKAERIDGLNPDVKRARRRILVAITVRHLGQKKAHLAKKDIAEMEALPQFGEGDRPAFLAALKCVCAMIEGEESELRRSNNDLIGLMGSRVPAMLILEGLFRICGLRAKASAFSLKKEKPLKGHELASAVARGCRLGDDMGVPMIIPSEYEAEIEDFFATNGSSSDTSVSRVIAEAALRNNNMELAYAASGAGLSNGGAASARFLLLRAQSLPYWNGPRKSDCINAAIELGRRERDMGLIDDAIELLNGGNDSMERFSIWGTMMGKWDSSMDPEDVGGILRREKEAREYPTSPPMSLLEDFDDDDGYDDNDINECLHCDVKDCPNRTAEYMPAEDEWDDDAMFGNLFDDDLLDDLLDDDLLDLPPGFPSEAIPLIMEMALKYGGKDGQVPDPDELMKKDPKSANKILQILLDAEAGVNAPDFGRDLPHGYGRSSRKSKRKRRK